MALINKANKATEDRIALNAKATEDRIALNIKEANKATKEEII